MARIVALDLETDLAAPGIAAPRIACGSVAGLYDVPELLYPSDVLPYFDRIVVGTEIIAGANLAYDFGCIAAARPTLETLRKIWSLYDSDRVFDVLIAEALNAIAGGHLGKDHRTGGPLISPSKGTITDRYSLELVCDLVLGHKGAKANDYWRKRYGILRHVPISEWPADALRYPIDDVVNTRNVAIEQLKQHRNLHEMRVQAETAWCLHLASMTGLRTDPVMIEALKTRHEQIRAEQMIELKRLGFYRSEGKKEGTKDSATVKRAVALAYGASLPCPVCAGTSKVVSEKSGKPINCKACGASGLDIDSAPAVPRTETDGISTDRDTLEESGDESLMTLAEVDSKALGTYIPYLEQSIEFPINPRANVLLASGRTSYDGSIQTFPRKGGFRECYIADEGEVFCSTDYPAQELCTLAQACLWIVGRSKMADLINASGDPGSLHTAFAAKMRGVTFEEALALLKAKDALMKDYRQCAKPFNFGFPGGMGDVKVVLTNRKRNAGSTTAKDGTKYSGIRFCILLAGAERCGVEKVTTWNRRECPPVCRKCVEIAAQMRAEWLALYDEMPEYFHYVKSCVDSNGEIQQFISNRVRGGLGFCDGANTIFQGLGADGAKNSLRLITRECYIQPESPLFGTRVKVFQHDEIITSIPREKLHAAAHRQADLMVEGMRPYTPDIKFTVQPAAMLRWYKEAEPVYDSEGLLIPWEPRKD